MKKEKHPYYDSDRKQITETFAINAIMYSFIGIAFILALSSLIR